ncbi:preprotein translocase subunit SecE [Buchnera aphidicola]|uniref:preprotein translocase subunit SecE n=1 Tax=Buchnera aphidicola TaxID=9 RepID=UPI0034649737
MKNDKKKKKTRKKKINFYKKNILKIFIVIITIGILYLINIKKINIAYIFIIITLIFNVFIIKKLIQIIKKKKITNLEIKKINWLNKKSTLKITTLIFISSIILSTVLWILDKTIFFIISTIIHIRF